MFALYDVQPGNGTGPFLHPGACMGYVDKCMKSFTNNEAN